MGAVVPLTHQPQSGADHQGKVMKMYQVLDAFFNPIGTVHAESAEAALAEAKRRWKYVPAVMVEELRSAH